MPYRRLPKTDAARLKALKTLLDNNDIYTARNKFIDWKLINSAQPLHDRLLTATEQYKISLSAQAINAKKIDGLQYRACMFLSHFIQVLLMSVERGEIKRKKLLLYELDEDATSLPNIKSADGVLLWAPRIIKGEKERIKQGGKPIYNPSIGMVATHFDIYNEAYTAQRKLQARTNRDNRVMAELRPTIDDLILELWNVIEAHFANLPPKERYEQCSKFGIIYYYRKNEERL